jgi:acetyltransferase EpsM
MEQQVAEGVTPIIIIGAGGHGSEVASYIRDLSKNSANLRLIGFVDEHKARGPWCGTEILGNVQDCALWVRQQPAVLFRYLTAVGDNRVRQHLVRAVSALDVSNLKAWTLRHPSASIGQDVSIGEGTCLAPGSIVTTQVRLGDHCILNVNAAVSHDCEVGDFVNINPGAVVCGNVKIGTGCYIGAGATIIDKVSIGAWTVIGAGATVIDDLPAGVTAVGVPARIVRPSPFPQE